MSRILRIAVDGPSGAGKSTVARQVAKALGIDYIDTGAMYRAVAYKMIREGISSEDRDALKEMLAHTEIDVSGCDTLLDGENISGKIRTPEIAKMASDASAVPEVREKLVAIQRKLGRSKSVIMDGRDIGTNVFPDAEYKFFLTASVPERARRRWLELRTKGQDISLETVASDIEKRDYNDSHRALNPLRKAEDAVEVDSTEMGQDQVAEFILDVVKNEKTE